MVLLRQYVGYLLREQLRVHQENMVGVRQRSDEAPGQERHWLGWQDGGTFARNRVGGIICVPSENQTGGTHMEITYTLVGDYYRPNLVAPESPKVGR